MPDLKLFERRWRRFESLGIPTAQTLNLEAARSFATRFNIESTSRQTLYPGMLESSSSVFSTRSRVFYVLNDTYTCRR